MNRVIKFRGKRKDGSWIYGMPTYDFEHIFNSEQLDSPDNYEIIPETIGEFTGLYAQNGKEIYEGDIFGGIWGESYIAYCDKCKQFQLFNPCKCCFACDGDVHWYDIANDENLEIIGNVHDNKELLNFDT